MRTRRNGGTRGRGRRRRTRTPACSRARSGAPRASASRSGIDLLRVDADHAPEALARRAGAERRVEREERRRRVAELAPAARAVEAAPEGPLAVVPCGASSEPARENAVSARGRRSPAATPGPTDEAPHDEPQASFRIQKRRGRRRPISTISPSGRQRPEESGALVLGQPRPVARHASGGDRMRALRGPSRRAGATSDRAGPVLRRAVPRRRGRRRPARRRRRQSGQIVSPPCAKSRRSESCDLGLRPDRRAARCGRRSSARARSPAGRARSSRRRAGRAARGTGARRSRATPRSAAAPRRRACRRRATTCPSPRRP